jgi:methyltransferase (TIGR00027 family)
METGQPSRTALGAGAHRAAHQVLEHGAIFQDPLALRILGPHAERLVEDARNDPSRRGLRIFIAVRTRFAEDALAQAIGRGVQQLVVLGAGLDTYAYRTSNSNLRIFEVDHPATQAWKRACLAAASIAVPSSLTYAPVDFERDTLANALASAGFDASQPAFFTWLGVVPYLTDTAVFATLGFIASLPTGSHVVFDYSNPSGSDESARQAASRKALAERVAQIGEPLRVHYETPALHERLRSLGFNEIDDMSPRGMAARYFPQRVSDASGRGGHIVRAAKA